MNDENGEMIGAVESMTDITSLYMKEMELEELKQELRQEYWFMGLLGKSAPMQKLFEQIRNAAISEAPVLICGESGTGKNLVAQAIHALSRRKDGPFVAMNCGSLNDYLLESELFGHRKGSFTGRRERPDRQVRGRAQRQHFPGRDRRHAEDDAGQTTAGHRRETGGARRRPAAHPGQYPADFGDEQGPERTGQLRTCSGKTCSTA